jgi:hypothetical protein
MPYFEEKNTVFFWLLCDDWGVNICGRIITRPEGMEAV